MNVARVENRFANITTIRVFVTRFFQKPFKVAVSCAKSSKSFTFGFLIVASTIPANQPGANRGLSEVIGEATIAVRIDNI